MTHQHSLERILASFNSFIEIGTSRSSANDYETFIDKIYHTIMSR